MYKKKTQFELIFKSNLEIILPSFKLKLQGADCGGITRVTIRKQPEAHCPSSNYIAHQKNIATQYDHQEAIHSRYS